MDHDDRPNILLFIPHDLGDHLHCCGHPSVRSPNLDRLAQTGVRFTNCFTTAPECTPSRAGLYTGQYVHQNGLVGLCHRGWEFAPDTRHLAQRLWDAGYETCLFGHQHETFFSPARLGYNRLFAQKRGDSGVAVAEEAADWLHNDAARLSRPWFACVGFLDTHRPWRPAKDFAPKDVDVPAYLPDLPEVRADLAELHQAVFDMDCAIGRVLDALEGSPLAARTLVVYTVDHGIPFPRAKSTFYDPGIRVPMILRLPGRFEGGTEHDALLSNLDFTPTILDLCGVAVPDGLEGRSFLPLLQGRAYEERDAVFGALYYDAAYDPMHYVRTRTHKYIRSFAVTPEDATGAEPEVLCKFTEGEWIRAGDTDVQRSPTWLRLVERQAGPFLRPPREELYDLRRDPLEMKNLAGNTRHTQPLADLRLKLHAMMERTRSPLLHGHVSPAGSRTRNQRY